MIFSTNIFFKFYTKGIPIITGCEDESCDSDDSEYTPKKVTPLKVKRGRGRPRKNPDAPPKAPKVPGRGRGRPSTKVKKEKEEEEIGEYPCWVCSEVFTTLTKLDKHAKVAHDGFKVREFIFCVVFSKITLFLM